MPSHIIECGSLQDFINCVKSHNCSESPRIINWDRAENPSVFKIGFRCLDCGEVWSLGLSSLRKNIKALQDGGLSLIREYNELANDKHGQIMCNDFVDALLNKL